MAPQRSSRRGTVGDSGDFAPVANLPSQICKNQPQIHHIKNSSPSTHQSHSSCSFVSPLFRRTRLLANSRSATAGIHPLGVEQSSEEGNVAQVGCDHLLCKTSDNLHQRQPFPLYQVGSFLHQFELKGMRRSYAEVVSSSLVWANGDRWMPSPAAARGKVRFRFPCLVTEFWKEDAPVMVGRAAGPFDLNSSISVKPILG
jgi:hypothetical protein